MRCMPVTVAGESAKPATRGRFLAKFSLMAASFVFCILVGEAVLRFGVLFDHVEFETDSELLWRHRPDQVVRVEVAREGRKQRAMTIDDRGYRRTLPAARPGARRVLALGDSAMFGWAIDDDETFCSQLQVLGGGKLDVINTAVGGWGLFQLEILLRNVIGTIQPDIILVHLQSCDVVRQPFPADQPYRKRAFLWESRIKNTIRRYSKLASLFGHLAQLVVLGHLNRGIVSEVPQVEGTHGDGPTAAFRKCWEQDRRRLIAVKELADRHGAKLVVIVGGPRDQVSGRPVDRNIPFFNTEMTAVSRELGIIQVNPVEPFRSYSLESLIIAGDGHPSVLWNRLIAQEIHRTLGAGGMIDKNDRLTAGR